MGVTKQGKKYRARRWRDGKHLSIGTYNTEREAWVAYWNFTGPEKPIKRNWFKRLFRLK